MSKYLDRLFQDVNINPSSKSLYIRNILTLYGKDKPPLRSLNFLDDIDAIKERLEPYKDNTKRNFLIAIVSALKHIKYKKPLYKKYSTLLDHYNTSLKDQTSKTESETANWLSQNEIMEVYRKLHRETLSQSPIEYNKLLRLLLLALYVLHPPRRNKDYQLMKIVPKHTDDMDKHYNYLDLSTNQFIFNNYKTARVYHTQYAPVHPDFLPILRLYLLKYPKTSPDHGVFLVTDVNGDPYTHINSITRLLNRIFNKPIGSSMLRKIYLTDKYSSQNQDKNNDASLMGTSVSTINNNYVKLPNNKRLL